MIFVTVGTGAPFDSLLMEIDRLAELGILRGRIICQAGRSLFQMKHAEQFVAKPSIREFIDESHMVFTHGGATVIELLSKKKNFVAFPNPIVSDNHQESFLREISSVSNISWSADVSDLQKLYEHRVLVGAPEVLGKIPRAQDLLRAALFGRK